MRCTDARAVLAELATCLALPSPTPPGDAADVAAWVAEWGKELGAHVAFETVWPGADNVLATLDFGPGPRLVFNSHMDVVDPSTQTWRTAPFTPTEVDGLLYGRGACDAKGSLVAMLAAMERLATDPRGLTGSLVLTAVVGEEAGGLGSRHLVRDGLAAEAAVVGEPTGLSIARAHKGTYMHRLRFTGRAAHSASPWLGRNAVADAAAFVAACEEETVRLAGAPHPAVGPATMTVTTITGGTFQNTVPAEAVLTVDRRLVPGETHAVADEQRARLLADLQRARPGLDVTEEQLVATVPSETAPDDPIVRAGLAAVASVGRGQPEASGFNAGCDMSKLVGAGIPTIICGPGSLAQAHGPDEFVPMAEVVEAVAIYEHVARSMLHGGTHR
jgi:acetylornithine deacetylase/succinyl-diaminopimelate desuccinylase family protein